jgi:cold shock CspA family protein
MTGKIIRLIREKGFGFIKAEDGKEYFFHREEINGFWDDFHVDNEVEFEAVSSPKGPRGTKVMLVNQYNSDVE